MIVAVVAWVALYALGGDAAVAAAPSDVFENRASGEELFRRGVAAYDAHDYIRAIEWFRKAYAMDAEPAILFNIAQAERAVGDCPKALESLDAFLAAAKPGDPLVARARAKRDELETCAASHAASARSKVEPVKPLSPPQATPPVPKLTGPPVVLMRERPGFFSTPAATVCTVTAGGTIALGLTDLALAITAHTLASRVGASMTWDDPTQTAEDERRAFGKAATITTVALGLTAAVAGTSCWLHWRRTERAVTMEVR